MQAGSGSLGKSTGRKVVCSVCGKKGSVRLGKDGKVADRGWNFFGRFALNAPADRNLYDLASNQAEGGLEAEEAEKAMRESRLLTEYWECEDCARDLEKDIRPKP